MAFARLAVPGLLAIAAVVALISVQQPAAVDAPLPGPPIVVPEDWFSRAANDRPTGRNRVLSVGMPSPARATDTRRFALQGIVALAEMPGQLEDSALANAALGHADPAVRGEAVHVLGERGGIIALQTFLQALHDPSPRVREETIRALVVIGGVEAVLALASTLDTADTSTRLHAVDALGELAGLDITRYLKPMLQDENDAVREAAAQWLAELTAQ